jgi:hypothetical protein
MYMVISIKNNGIMSFTFTVNTVYVPQDSLVLSTQNGPLHHPELKVNTQTHI